VGRPRIDLHLKVLLVLHHRTDELVERRVQTRVLAPVVAQERTVDLLDEADGIRVLAVEDDAGLGLPQAR
jgi:hypothetical protein